MKNLLFVAFIFISSFSFSQNVNKKIDAQSKDPKTKENAAKADVYIHKKTIIDSTVAYKPATVDAKTTSVKTSAKKKKFKKKTKSN